MEYSLDKRLEKLNELKGNDTLLEHSLRVSKFVFIMENINLSDKEFELANIEAKKSLKEIRKQVLFEYNK